MEYKAPTKPLDYTIDWSSWLSTGDTVTTSTFTLETGLVEDSKANTTTTTTITVSGGVAGTTYSVKNSIVTANALETDRTFYIQVAEQLV